jgi:hypothetical protein
MSITPADEQDHAEGAAEKQADAMKDQLRKDVASWSAARSEVSSRDVAEATVPVVRQPPSPTAKRLKRPRPASPAVVAGDAGKKPFRMSYDGVTEADYITYMITRGAR